MSHQPLHGKTVFDDWQTITVSVFMALVGYSVMVGIPVISTAWVTQLGFSEVEVGRVAGADLGGLSVGSVLASLVMGRFNRRVLVIAGVTLALTANASCMFLVQYEQVLWLRVLAGIGSGIITAVAVASLGATNKPARSFNILLFAFAFSQFAEIRFLPALSMNGIYSVFLVTTGICVLLLKWIPAYPIGHSKSTSPPPEALLTKSKIAFPDVPKYVPWLCLCGIFVTYINIGAYWTYIELASLDSGVTAEWTGFVLAWASFLSIVGCAFATLLSNRFGLARPLFGALITMALIVGMLAGGVNNINLMISAFMFNFLWIFIDVYQMSSVANVDRTGSFASLMPGAQGLGQIVGPNIAATILGWQLGYRGVFIMCASAALGGLVIYAILYSRLKKSNPEVADAS
jgi:MFS family permease